MMIKTTLKIEGMMCPMCEVHITDAIRKEIPNAKKIKASRHKKEASFLTDEPVDAESLKAAIGKTGYDYLSAESVPYEKKGWFGR
jgi:copper chaperone CopZ